MAERDDTIAEILVGAAVLAVAVGFFVYASSTAGSSFRAGGGYELTASFRSAEGVSLGTEVRMAGVRIGSVTGMTLNPETFRADTTFTVADGLEIPDDSAIAISSEGLLGGTFVEIIPGGSPFVLEPGGEIYDTQSSVSLITLLLRFVTGDDGS
jgi:phospholipid/cholesterol/gamma-HCH transport system substrate-binding protein